jgi:hypothetical protein
MRKQNISFLFVMVLVLTSFLAACSPASSASVSANPNLRTLNVSGSGQVVVNPDLAYINLGSRAESVNPGEAVAQSNAQIESIINVLKSKGISEQDIATSNFNIYSMEDYGFDGQRTGMRYVVENTVGVTVRDLPKLGEILQAAIEAGANNVYGISFDLEDKTEILAKARELAVENGTEKAQDLAQLTGVELGALYNVSIFGGVPMPFNMGGKGGGVAYESALADVPVSPGQLTITVEVNMTFEIK